ncbi:hypothetical protein [Prescottella agglutinans]
MRAAVGDAGSLVGSGARTISEVRALLPQVDIVVADRHGRGPGVPR